MSENANQEGRQRTFTVVLRCSESAIRVPQGKGIRIFPILTPLGTYELSILTRTESVTGFETPLPRELWIEVKGPAPTLLEAVNMAVACADEYSRLIAFATNAWQGLLNVHLAFENQGDSGLHEFFQNWLLDEKGLIRPARMVQPDVALRVIEAYARLDPGARNRIMRAVYLYTDALQHWKHGGEVHALSFVYMGIEAITPLVLMDEVQRRGLKSRAELDEQLNGAPPDSLALRLATWLFVRAGGRRGSQLDSWVRREIIFRGDKETYRSAKAASDKWEHATDDRAEIRELALKVSKQTAHYLRRSLLELLRLSPTDLQFLQGGELEDPASTLGLQRWMTGVLSGEHAELAPQGEAYPQVRWEFTIKTFSIADNGRYEMSVHQKITPMLAPGVSLTLTGVHLSGPSPISHSNVTAEIVRAELKSVELSDGKKIEFAIDDPKYASWVHPYGSFMLNSSVVEPLSEFWISSLRSNDSTARGKRTLIENVSEIEGLLVSRNLPIEFRERCKSAWKEAVDLGEVHNYMATARTTPEGLVIDMRGREGYPEQMVMSKVERLVELNQKAMDVSKALLDLAGELGLLLRQD